MESSKKFKMIDQSFECNVCGKKVEPLGYTARDHCPYCLSSLHLDINPGDRLSICHGIMEPIGIENAKKGQYKIVYRCTKCGLVKRNIKAIDDNMDLIIKIMANPL